MIFRNTAASFLLTASLCAQPPATPRRPVTDIYHGVSVTDDYRWLEDFNDPAVKQWASAENAAARKYLDAIPTRAAIYKELLALDSQNGVSYTALIARPGRIFAFKFDPAKQHPQLVTLSSIDNPASEHVLLDPDQLDPRHLTEIDFFEPSLDGRYVAVSLSTGGSESGDVKVFDTTTSRPLPDIVPRVNGGTAGGSVAWNADASGFYYTRYPHAGERPAADLDFYQQIWFHKLGVPPTADTYSLGKDFPRIAEILLQSSPDGHSVLAAVAIGDGGDREHWLLEPTGAWTQIARVSDEVTALAFGFDHDLYALSRNGAPRGKVLRLTHHQPISAAATVVPESEVVIESVVPLHAGLCVLDLAGGPSGLRFFLTAGPKHIDVPIPPISSVSSLTRLDDDSVAFSRGGYLTTADWYRFDPRGGRVSPVALQRTPPVDVSRYEVVRDFAISRDGTKVPINIIRAKGIALDGSHPALLTGYGGYSISMQPRFSRFNLVLLERGFVLAEANLRGGGEYGVSWHDQGKLTKKQNVFDDFAACASYLIDQHYTQPSKLGIRGGSNGGLLMGAAFTQHPELFRAVVSQVGIYDMLRVELSPNGAFNVTEFGTVKEQDQFRAMQAYSPYHHVTDGTQYPAILFLTGDNDPRVDPMNSRKMTARLQASGTRRPVLLRTSGNSGHGIGTSRNEALAQAADIYAFLVQELVAAGRPPVK